LEIKPGHEENVHTLSDTAEINDLFKDNVSTANILYHKIKISN